MLVYEVAVGMGIVSEESGRKWKSATYDLCAQFVTVNFSQHTAKTYRKVL
jgi:hypothetical protein